jgi:hypothetical protein
MLSPITSGRALADVNATGTWRISFVAVEDDHQGFFMGCHGPWEQSGTSLSAELNCQDSKGHVNFGFLLTGTFDAATGAFDLLYVSKAGGLLMRGRVHPDGNALSGGWSFCPGFIDCYSGTFTGDRFPLSTPTPTIPGATDPPATAGESGTPSPSPTASSTAHMAPEEPTPVREAAAEVALPSAGGRAPVESARAPLGLPVLLAGASGFLILSVALRAVWHR